jgi:hypothetical protein
MNYFRGILLCLLSNQLLTGIKRSVTIFLIILLGLNSFGLSFLFWAQIQLCKIKAERYSGDPSGSVHGKKLILFSSVNKNIRLVDEDEILADGKMYDIVKKQRHNGLVLYYALSDEDEDGYNANLTSLAKNDPSKNSLPGKTIKLYEEKYFAGENDNVSTPQTVDIFPEGKTITSILFHPSPLRDILSPPPDCLKS